MDKPVGSSYAPAIELPLGNNLLQETQKCAESRDRDPHQYGAYAIRLHNTASSFHFHPLRTVLYRPDLNDESAMLELPDLSDIANRQTLHRKKLRLHLTNETYRETSAYAHKANVTPYERMRQSLRFANFVIQNTQHSGEDILFLHMGKEFTLPDIDKIRRSRLR